jgi:two-component system cell cycle sensor histidine kinase/response regulator CckA
MTTSLRALVLEDRRSSETLVSALLEAATDLVAIGPVEGPASYLNTAGRQLLGVGPEEKVSLLEHCPKAAQQVIREEAIPAAIQEGVWSGESVLLSKTGEEIPVSQLLIAHKAPSGAVEFLSTIARDLRGPKRLEEQFRQAQKMETVGRLAAGIAHDFNNLLTLITGYSQLALSSLPRPHPLCALLEPIASAGERAALLTHQLQAYSRKQVPRPTVLDVNALLTGMEPLLGRLLGEDLNLVIRPADGLWPVMADAGQLEQVVLSLAVNARDAMPTGGKLLISTANVVLDESYARAHPKPRPGAYVGVTFRDSGCSMDAATRARLLEPFAPPEGSDAGTGLGLATVHGIVQQLGGHLEVSSEPGRDTTFQVYLPRAREAASTGPAHPQSRTVPRGTETVLVVEDDDSVRRLARLVLQREGYQVLEARDGHEVLLLAEQYQGSIHLLVTDVVMPELSGPQVAQRLLALRPETKVLYLSGYTAEALGHAGAPEADRPFLQKPFSPDALVRKVREVLDR